MNSDALCQGTILESEDVRHVVHRRTIAGRPAPTIMLASVPAEEDPDQTVHVRTVDVAVLWAAVRAGEVRVVEYGPSAEAAVPVPPPARRRRFARRRIAHPAIADLMRQGRVFYGSELHARRADAAHRRNGG